MTLIWFLCGILIWFAIGCAVLSTIDDEDQQLFKWAKKCPIFFGYELIVMAWPLILYLWARNR